MAEGKPSPAYEAYLQQKNKEALEGVPADQTIIHRSSDYNLPEHEVVREQLNQEEMALNRQLEQINEAKRKIAEKKEAISQVPVLFDSDDMKVMLNHLHNLDAAGINKIKVGEAEYSISQIKSALDYANVILKKLASDGILELDETQRANISSLLSKQGVTRQKISPHSKNGFREALVKAIEATLPGQRRPMKKVDASQIS